jgi:hypothetical protein
MLFVEGSTLLKISLDFPFIHEPLKHTLLCYCRSLTQTTVSCGPTMPETYLSNNLKLRSLI